MNTNILKGAVLALMLGGLAFPARAPAQDPAAEAARLRTDIARLKRDIQRAESDARRADSLARDEQSAAARSAERLVRDRERRDKENAALTARIQSARGRINTERTRQQAAANGIEEIKAREKALLAHFAGVADSLLARVETGLPWDTETRRDRIVALKRDLEAGTAAPEEAFSRLVAILREETKNGDEISLLSRPLTRRNGDVVNAQVLKLGNQALVYADDENKKFGILERRVENGKSAWVWREDLSFAQRNAVKKAVAVKSGREAPQLVPLPLDLVGLTQEGGR